MEKKKAEKSSRVCADCIHEWACMMQCGGHRMAQENATRCACYEGVKDSAAYLIGKLDAAAQQWISVKERLPEDGEHVLIWYKYFRYGSYNRMYKDYGIGYQYDGFWSGVDSLGVNARVFAWMPLPTPPKGEKNG